MDTAKRQAVWEGYFDAQFRQRYFLALKKRLGDKLQRLSIAIAVLSCGPLIGAVWQTGFSEWLWVTGVGSGLIGIYIGVAGLPRCLAVAIQAATVWGQTATAYASLWARCQSGEDVWAAHQALEQTGTWIDAIATEHLDVQDQALIETSFRSAEIALKPA